MRSPCLRLLRWETKRCSPLNHTPPATLYSQNMGNLTLDTLSVNGRRVSGGWYPYGSWDTSHKPLFVVGGLEPPFYISLQQSGSTTFTWSYNEWETPEQPPPQISIWPFLIAAPNSSRNCNSPSRVREKEAQDPTHRELRLRCTFGVIGVPSEGRKVYLLSLSSLYCGLWFPVTFPTLSEGHFSQMWSRTVRFTAVCLQLKRCYGNTRDSNSSVNAVSYQAT